MPLNIEIKANCKNPEKALEILKMAGAEYKGCDHQVDTYFVVPEGRLKLREGKIENNLIFYRRNDQAGPKRSEVILYPASKNPGLKKILAEVNGIKVVVDKQRNILFLGNVKFHVDEVKELGSFIEIEAIGEQGQEDQLNSQCRNYMEILGIVEEDLVNDSYSDILLKKNQHHA